MELQSATSHQPNPPWLFGLRLAARLSNYLLFLAALFWLGFGVLEPTVSIYVALILGFCIVNLHAITLSILKPIRTMRLFAHALNLALPVAFLAGSWLSTTQIGSGFREALIVGLPAALNWLAIEFGRQYRRQIPAAQLGGPQGLANRDRH